MSASPAPGTITFTVTIDPAPPVAGWQPFPQPDPDLWAIYRAVIETIEPGASEHCVRTHFVDGVQAGISHQRLGVTVSRHQEPA